MFEVYEEMSATVSGCVTGGYNYARAEVERIIIDVGYDHILSSEATIDYGHVSADYDVCYILAAYSAGMEQKGATKDDKKSKLDAVASQMASITNEVKETVVTIPVEVESEEQTTETAQYVKCTIHPFSASIILRAFVVDPDAPYSQFNTRTIEARIDYMYTKQTPCGINPYNADTS